MDIWKQLKIAKQLRMATSAGKIYWKLFLINAISVNWNLVLISLKQFLVSSLFETAGIYLQPMSKLLSVEAAVQRALIE